MTRASNCPFPPPQHSFTTCKTPRPLGGLLLDPAPLTAPPGTSRVHSPGPTAPPGTHPHPFHFLQVPGRARPAPPRLSRRPAPGELLPEQQRERPLPARHPGGIGVSAPAPCTPRAPRSQAAAVARVLVATGSPRPRDSPGLGRPGPPGPCYAGCGASCCPRRPARTRSRRRATRPSSRGWTTTRTAWWTSASCRRGSRAWASPWARTPRRWVLRGAAGGAGRAAEILGAGGRKAELWLPAREWVPKLGNGARGQFPRGRCASTPESLLVFFRIPANAVAHCNNLKRCSIVLLV